ncbi:MAG: YhcN/YlaJ family sporulation lipoprotein [Syntrophomonas sp.]
MNPKRTLIASLILLIIFSFMMAGCQKAQKPIQPQSTGVVNQAVAEAQKVPGVSKATAFEANNKIYMGLETTSNMTRQEAAALEEKVMNQVKGVNSSYTPLVTSEKETVAKIRDVSSGITGGRPVAMFNNDIADIEARINQR